MNDRAKTIEDLRAELFTAIQQVREGKMDTDRARAINEIGKTIVDSAKVEVMYLETAGEGQSTFIGTANGQGAPAQGALPGSAVPAPTPSPGASWPPGITSVTQHRLRG